MKILTFAALGMFALPCHAQQIGDPVTVPVTVTVSSVVLCDFDARLCTDESVNVVETEDNDMELVK